MEGGTELAGRVAQIARQAGAAIMQVYNHEKDFQVEQKADESPLTLADRRSNDIINAGLDTLEPRYPVVSEENRAIPFEERRHYAYHWLVDPLDGTKEFIKRNGEFTVNIALVHEGRPVLGVVYVPARDELYWAAAGAGAYMEVDGGAARRIHAAHFRLSDPGLRIVASRSHLNEETKAFIDRFEAPETVSRGSSLKFLSLAKGEAHVYPRLGPTMEWDTGAAQIVLEEAGGRVEVMPGGEPLRYNKESLLNPFFIAYGAVE